VNANAISELLPTTKADPPRRMRVAQDDLSILVDPEPLDEDEEAADDMFELDQKELGELGLTLDDPHQPGQE
jgi:hypothetical protein